MPRFDLKGRTKRIQQHHLGAPKCSLAHENASFLWSERSAALRVRTFDNAWVDAEGRISISSQRGPACHVHTTGGCYKHIYRAWTPPGVNITRLHNVVSLATHWGEGHYHFVVEALVGLAAIAAADQEAASCLRPSAGSKQCSIHVTQRSAFVFQWLRVVDGAFSRRQLADGHIFAKRLWVPELGVCKHIRRIHAEWLRQRVRASLMTAQSRTATIITNHLVLVRRSTFGHDTTALGEWRLADTFQRDLLANCKSHADAHSLLLRVHDDRALPPLFQQLRLFAAARIVVGLTGAGLTNLLATPQGSCVVELVGPKSFGRGVDNTYAALAGQLGLVHTRVHLRPSWSVDRDALTLALARC